MTGSRWRSSRPVRNASHDNANVISGAKTRCRSPSPGCRLTALREASLAERVRNRCIWPAKPALPNMLTAFRHATSKAKTERLSRLAVAARRQLGIACRDDARAGIKTPGVEGPSRSLDAAFSPDSPRDVFKSPQPIRELWHPAVECRRIDLQPESNPSPAPASWRSPCHPARSPTKATASRAPASYDHRRTTSIFSPTYDLLALCMYM